MNIKESAVVVFVLIIILMVGVWTTPTTTVSGFNPFNIAHALSVCDVDSNC